MSHNIKVVYFGTPQFSATILTKLVEFCRQNLGTHPGGGKLNISIRTVVTSPDKPVGRKHLQTESEVSQVAQKYGIKTLKPEKLTPEFIEANPTDLECDLFIVASYGKIIPKVLLRIPSKGAINVHGSILPKYRGASPIQSAILSGETTTGITIMLMDEKMDHGDILTTKSISITGQDNYLTLSNNMSGVACELLINTLVKIMAGEIKPQPQDHEKATFTKLIKKEDGYFDIDNPPSPEVLDRMIRAYYPWPSAWSKWNGKIIKYYPENMIQIEGKKPVKLEEFLRGYPDFPIKSFS